MQAHEFARRAGKIEFRHAQSTKAKRGALAKLITQAGAAYMIANGKITGYRMKDGSIACRKRRFPTLDAATAEIDRIHRVKTHEHVPVRAYACHCKAFHLTSKE
jgi:hypothetical protein